MRLQLETHQSKLMPLLVLVIAVSCLQLQKEEQCLGKKCKAFLAEASNKINFAGMDERIDHPAAKPEDDLSVSRLT